MIQHWRKFVIFAIEKETKRQLNPKTRKGERKMTTTAANRQIALNQIDVNTRYYEYDLGRTPRGRGSWAFSIGNLDGYRDATKAFFTDSMTYKEAVKVAKKEAQAKGATIIYVLP